MAEGACMTFCLDTNVFIQAWDKYYAIDFAAPYWDKLDELARSGVIFATEEVKREIWKTDDDLKSWLEPREYFFRPIDAMVIECLQTIYKNENNRRLVDSSKFRSVADPWVIAHAMAEKAVVVTKENYETNPTKRIKIPNVCEAMGIESIDDFQLIRRLNLRFRL
ncbi:MAG: DUF4411 family protein [Sedimentisphaerales bacterium]|nr:DUF4411 family protein [Sedimentisphaerales bacterium]